MHFCLSELLLHGSTVSREDRGDCESARDLATVVNSFKMFSPVLALVSMHVRPSLCARSCASLKST